MVALRWTQSEEPTNRRTAKMVLSYGGRVKGRSGGHRQFNALSRSEQFVKVPTELSFVRRFFSETRFAQHVCKQRFVYHSSTNECRQILWKPLLPHSNKLHTFINLKQYFVREKRCHHIEAPDKPKIYSRSSLGSSWISILWKSFLINGMLLTSLLKSIWAQQTMSFPIENFHTEISSPLQKQSAHSHRQSYKPLCLWIQML